VAQANRNRPVETWQGSVHLLQRTDLFDATTLVLPPKLRKWAPGKKEGQALIAIGKYIDE
jgi:hypothetical protein